jgi:hypothetical protein
MKILARVCGLLGIVSALFAAATAQGLRLPPQTQTVTLFAANKYHSSRDSCLHLAKTPRGCHLRYGSLYAGDDWDWFDTAGAKEIRTVVRDLGYLEWSDDFKVPVVAPFPKLGPGEERKITVNTSGADGADGAPGAPGRDGADADGVVRPHRWPAEIPVPPPPPSKPKHDGKPKIDPVFAKAILHHMYVVHVVDEVNDFYVLMRVEEVLRGDSCTVAWRVIPSPEDEGPIG